MKIKKWLALALSAVMAVGVLTACGGGGGGVKDSLSVGGVRTELKQVSSDFTVNEDSSLNVAVRAGAKKLAETGSESAATSYINSEMEWDGLSVVRNAFREIITQGFIIGGSVSGGVIQVVEADRLEKYQGSGGWGTWFSSNRDEIRKLQPINTPEKFAAALALSLDGTVGTLVSGLTNNYANIQYDVSGYKVEDPNGVDYWVFAAQITIG